MPRADFDSPWKDALEEYLEECFLLLFPQAHAAIDWTRHYTFLDTELQQVDPEGALGPRRVDKLVRVWLLDGRDAWILVHVEVQSQEEQAFRQQVRQIEEEGHMPYITSIERLGRAEGREEGREEGKRSAVRAVIAARFGTVPDLLSARIDAAAESELDALLVSAAVVPALEDL